MGRWIGGDLGKIVKIKTGKKDVNYGNPEGIYPFFTCSREHTFCDYYSYDTEALLIAGNGEVGNIKYYNGKFEAYQRTYILYDFNNIDPKFLLYYLDIYLRAEIERSKIGSVIQYIKLPMLIGLDVNRPESLDEQRKIAQILSKVDEAIDSTQALIDKHELIKEGMMHDLFTRGIDPATGSLRPHPSDAPELYQDSELGLIPKEWEVKSVGELLSEGFLLGVQDGNHGEIHPKSSDFVEEGVPFIMASDISKGFIDYTACKYISNNQYKSLRIGFSYTGDVLLSHKASIGFTAIADRNIMLTPQVTYYRCNLEKISNVFIKNSFNSSYFQKQLENIGKQSTRSYIGILGQRVLKLVIPESTQEQFVISKYISQTDKCLSNLHQQKQKLLLQKQGLMHDLLSGKVRVV